jgi:molybdopterin-binding protein
MAANTTSLKYRGAVAGRVLAAIPLNYLLTSIITALLARHLSLARQEATIAAMLASFAIFAVIALAVFYARSAVRAWLWMIGAVIVLGALLALSLHMAPRL